MVVNIALVTNFSHNKSITPFFYFFSRLLRSLSLTPKISKLVLCCIFKFSYSETLAKQQVHAGHLLSVFKITHYSLARE